jgi:hypothetical protein
MAITVDWPNKLILVPQADLTPVVGTLYSLDTDVLRRQLLDLEDDPEGMPWERTHRHNTTVTVAGVTYARTIEIINGYAIQFEDGAYSVRLEGSNNNIFDIQNGVLVQNQVQVIPTNSAGLVETSVSGLTPSESADLASLASDYASLDVRVGFLETLARAKKVVSRTFSKLFLSDSVSGRTFEADIFKDEAETEPYDGEGIEVQGEITET